MIKREILNTDTISRVAADCEENVLARLSCEVCRW